MKHHLQSIQKRFLKIRHCLNLTVHRRISNSTSQQLYYTENGDQSFLKHLEEYIPAQGGGWIIHFYAPGNDFTSALPDVEKVLTSIRINTR